MHQLLAIDLAGLLVAEGDTDRAIDSLKWLRRQIEADASARRFDAWGSSTVIDEHAGKVIPKELFERLHEIARLDARWPVGNAGLLHVYGYLLSTRLTPYGLKRARWLDGRLAMAYGLPDDGFLPLFDDTTLLERVTRETSALLGDETAPRRRETLRGAEATIAVRRDAGAECAAVAYGIDRGDGLRLITTFPVDARPDEFLATLGRARPRWNAVTRERRRPWRVG